MEPLWISRDFLSLFIGMWLNWWHLPLGYLDSIGMGYKIILDYGFLQLGRMTAYFQGNWELPTMRRWRWSLMANFTLFIFLPQGCTVSVLGKVESFEWISLFKFFWVTEIKRNSVEENINMGYKDFDLQLEDVYVRAYWSMFSLWALLASSCSVLVHRTRLKKKPH